MKNKEIKLDIFDLFNNDVDYENHYEYISHINLKLETYLTIDEVK